ANSKFVRKGGTIIIDEDNFTDKNIKKAGYESDPFKEDKLGDFNIISAPISTLVKETLKDHGLDPKTVMRTKNMFALGMVYWLFGRDLEYTDEYFKGKFSKRPKIIEANSAVLHAGFNYAETIDAMSPVYKVSPASIEKGLYRTIDGNTATSWGLLAAAEKSGLDLFIGSYPITPASGILETLAARKDLGVKSFQAEDEIAGICTAIGASFAGNLAVTTTSGPGLALKSEAAGLAVMTELPIVIVNVQRGGPSTGLPTKTEQSDLLQALYGRNGESPMVVIAASTPSNCFDYAFQAARIALEHMVPVILLTDGFLANGSEPWKIPSVKDLPGIKAPLVKEGEDEFIPYERDEKTLARKWAVPGVKGREHRIGGLEKTVKGTVSYIPENHENMVNMRAGKVARVVSKVPDQEVYGDEEGDLLLIGWGGTYGHLLTAVRELREKGKKVSLAHFNYINPLPANTKKLFSSFKKLVVAELNAGQFVKYLRMEFEDFKFYQINKIQGLPFTCAEIEDECIKILEE
ncbi:MAG TPA: 2-oxoacid:acceptor oxidoreductase subunit alpha, partial [Bacteroidales bacterium]|nr:2-oxoacid:acceptor oxidoreductase subunit alpha [Bacteroidales bacterium]